ncbi:uncharacterized protein PAC_18941 [Phialocephala subalpina]|uniref:RING-type domain-containing protein n=1 Tax=Phialocephala subalpina TaxID=576137 RepID=A0A1L7XVN3_9HELO|nr:uncharacterized protein PAC_18941 [Phialocephala subalpina]
MSVRSMDHGIDQLFAAFLTNDQTLVNTPRSLFGATNIPRAITSFPIRIRLRLNSLQGLLLVTPEPSATKRTKKENDGNTLMFSLSGSPTIVFRSFSSGTNKQSTSRTKSDTRIEELSSNHAESSNSGREKGKGGDKGKTKTPDDSLLLFGARPRMTIAFDSSNGKSQQKATNTKNDARIEEIPSDHGESSNSDREKSKDGDKSKGKVSDDRQDSNLDVRTSQSGTCMIVVFGSSSGTDKQSAKDTKNDAKGQQKRSDHAKFNNCQEKSKKEGEGKGKGKAPNDKKEDENNNSKTSEEEIPFDVGVAPTLICPICKEELKNPVVQVSPCGHKFERECWEWWYNDQQARGRKKHSGPVPVNCPLFGAEMGDGGGWKMVLDMSDKEDCDEMGCN